MTDRLPDDGETISTSMFFMQPAGKGSSSAVAAYRLTRPNPKNSRQTHEEAVEDEIHVRMVGAVSDDDQFGHPLVQNLADCGVNTDGVVFIKGKRTGVANILVEAPSGAKRVMEHLGAATALEPSDFMTLESLGGGVAPDLVIAQLEMRRVTIERAIETAHRENVEVLLKPSPPRVLMPEIYPMISHLVMNETEAAMLSECTPDEIENQTGLASVADYFLELGVKNVVVTLGEKGAYYANKSGHGHVEAEKNCTVIDTSGAGCVSHRLRRFHFLVSSAHL